VGGVWVLPVGAGGVGGRQGDGARPGLRGLAPHGSCCLHSPNIHPACQSPTQPGKHTCLSEGAAGMTVKCMHGRGIETTLSGHVLTDAA
jgi:hypothetical protein